MQIVQNTVLPQEGWETSVAQAFTTIFYTGNYFASCSVDGGKHYKSVSPSKLAESVGHKFCCDQSAHYIPIADTMVWILLADDGPVLMCLASSNDVLNSKGKDWTVYTLTGPVFSRGRDTQFDYPQISFGDYFVYLTFNIIDTADAIICRFHVGQLRERGTLHFQYFVITNNSFICPCQLSGDRGLFVTENTTSQLRIFEWKEQSNTITTHDVNIETIPTEDWSTLTPSGYDWLNPNSKVNTEVHGATRTGDQLWIAWTGARRVYDQRKNSFPFPHIGIAVVHIHTMQLAQQRYLWNGEHAFAYPSLASNPSGEVAITFSWGGGVHYVQHGVGFLTGQTELYSTTSDEGLEGGSHYMTARMAFPEINRFIAAGWNSPKDTSLPGGRRNKARYVVFHR